MIPHDIQLQIIQKLHEETNVNDWTISGPEVEARECIIYKASNNQYPNDIAIKIYRKQIKKISTLQYDVLERFAKTLNKQNNEFSVPNVFGVLPKQGIFMMEWIEAPALERRLWRYFYSKKHVQSDIRRCFSWLKEFHTLANLEKKIVDIDSYKNIFKQCFKNHEGEELLSNNIVFSNGKVCFDNLVDKYSDLETFHADLHGDFTPSNILIDDHKVTAIDMFGNQHLPVDNDIALLFSYIAIEYPNMLTRYDFKLPPSEWPLLKLILDAYEYPNNTKQLNFFLFVFLFQLLRRWTIINHRNKNKRTTLLDKWRLKNTEMIVKNLCVTLNNIDS